MEGILIILIKNKDNDIKNIISFKSTGIKLDDKDWMKTSEAEMIYIIKEFCREAYKL